MLFIDVFCGAGGFTEGLKMAGWTHVCGIELDKHAALTYAANNHNDVIQKDVRQVTMEDIRPYIKKNANGRTRIDVLAGSPPCTSFSTAGNRTEGDERDELYLEMIRLASVLNPKIIILENVMGMLTKRNTRRNNETYANLVVQDFQAAGWKCEYRVLNTLHFGVPQTRRRVIFIASKTPSLIRFPETPPPPLPVLPIRNLILHPNQVPDKYFYSLEKNKYWRANPYTRFLDLDKPSPTIRATYFKSQGEHGLIEYNDGRIRRLTEKEVARIQGFPDTFTFVGSATQIYKQIGNAVAPPMAKGIALGLRSSGASQ